MIMVKIKTIISLMLAGAFISVAGCSQNPGNPQTTDTDHITTQENTSSEATTITDETTTEETPKVPKTLKILAVGNSYSTDAMQYLAQIALELGVEDVTLGNLYIGGCSLDTHYTHAKVGDGAYTYYKTNSGQWTSTSNATLFDGLKDEAWDIITLQQTSKTCGLPESYSKLPDLIKIINENKLEGARLMWHMTWAYQQNSTHSSFPNYNSDQMTMYNMLLSATEKAVDIRPEFCAVIPVGTAIQNARTGFIGDTLTRDGYHLSYNIGRMIAAMTWFETVTGCSVSELKFNPSPKEITDDVMNLMKESVANAVKEPRKVTKSVYTTGQIGSSEQAEEVLVNPEDRFEADKALASSIGVDLSKYTLFKWEYTENGYWYCTKHAEIVKPGSSTSTYNQNVCSAKRFSKTELPVGSLIICDSGWQYRPELWVSGVDIASKRPAITTNNITVMDNAWWGENSMFAFNISASPKADISKKFDIAASHLRIYVPNK